MEKICGEYEMTEICKKQKYKNGYIYKNYIYYSDNSDSDIDSCNDSGDDSGDESIINTKCVVNELDNDYFPDEYDIDLHIKKLSLKRNTLIFDNMAFIDICFNSDHNPIYKIKHKLLSLPKDIDVTYILYTLSKRRTYIKDLVELISWILIRFSNYKNFDSYNGSTFYNLCWLSEDLALFMLSSCIVDVTEIPKGKMSILDLCVFSRYNILYYEILKYRD